MGVIVIFLGLIITTASAIELASGADLVEMGNRAALLNIITVMGGLITVAVGFAVTRQFSPGGTPIERQKPQPAPETPAAPPAEVAAPKVDPVQSAADAQKAGDLAAVQLLGLLQEKGRFVDFVMDDVTAYSDAQVGAAARVVHQGCKAVIADYFEVEPIQTAKENTSVTLEADFEKADYRLVGNVGGEPPFSGVLRHKGWRTRAVKLPRSTRVAASLPPLAPAEVELK